MEEVKAKGVKSPRARARAKAKEEAKVEGELGLKGKEWKEGKEENLCEAHYCESL